MVDIVQELKVILEYETLNNFLKKKLINLNSIPFQAILNERKVISFGYS